MLVRRLVWSAFAYTYAHVGLLTSSKQYKERWHERKNYILTRFVDLLLAVIPSEESFSSGIEVTTNKSTLIHRLSVTIEVQRLGRDILWIEFAHYSIELIMSRLIFRRQLLRQHAEKTRSDLFRIKDIETSSSSNILEEWSPTFLWRRNRSDNRRYGWWYLFIL